MCWHHSNPPALRHATKADAPVVLQPKQQRRQVVLGQRAGAHQRAFIDRQIAHLQHVGAQRERGVSRQKLAPHKALVHQAAVNSCSQRHEVTA